MIKKGSVRCSNCGSVAQWCEDCKKFRCEKCGNTYTVNKGKIKKMGKKGCGCGK